MINTSLYVYGWIHSYSIINYPNLNDSWPKPVSVGSNEATYVVRWFHWLQWADASASSTGSDAATSAGSVETVIPTPR